MTFFGVLFSLILLAITGVIVYAGYVFQNTVKTLPSTEVLSDYIPGGVTEVYATDMDPATGKNVLLGRVYGQFKEYAAVNELPDLIKDATIAIEDERFYNHAGFDVWAIGRAVYKDVRSGRMGEGASTLTQQLARNLTVESSSGKRVAVLSKKKTLDRKLQELLLAVQFERNLSKEQILEMYLNEVCYGNNTYGAKAAAKVYFNKPLNKLSLAEAALLAGLPQRPTAFDPFDHLDAAVERRNTVLKKMKELKLAKPELVAKALKEKPKLASKPDPGNVKFKAPYFTNYILRQLIEKYGKDKVYAGGLKVYTTLNWEMQKQGENALREGVKQGRGDGVTEGALVSVEPRTGYIRAMVGGVDFDHNKYNNVTQGHRQPGSSFKVFVYTAAFMTGKYDPETGVDDSPVSFGKWSPKNYGGGYHGYTTIRNALMHSYNIPAVKVGNAIGIQKVIDVARKMGIQSPLQPNLSLSLGSAAVTPLEMASAYSTFPNRGSHAQPMTIIRVLDAEGVTLENNQPQVERQVIPETVISDMSSMLKDVVDHGTAASAAGIHEVEDAHGKTGTTNDNRDAWFVGYTPELSTSVWVCGVRREKKGKKTVVRYPPMEGVTGGHVCAPIWAAYMKVAVPIQRRAAEANRESPEKVIPKNADVKADLNVTTPQASPSPKPEVTPKEELVIPRTEPTTAPEEGDRGKRNRAGATNEEAVPSPGTDVTENPNEATAAVPDALPTPQAVQSIADNPEKSTSNRRSRIREAASGSIAIGAREISVSLCADTGLRATRWCPETVTRTMAVNTIPRGTCKKHRPLPGDQ